jgi:hypothetical protein
VQLFTKIHRINKLLFDFLTMIKSLILAGDDIVSIVSYLVSMCVVVEPPSAVSLKLRNDQINWCFSVLFHLVRNFRFLFIKEMPVFFVLRCASLLLILKSEGMEDLRV